MPRGGPAFCNGFESPGGRPFVVFRRVGGFGFSSLLVLDSIYGEGGAPFATVLNFRVAAPSWFFEGSVGSTFQMCADQFTGAGPLFEAVFLFWVCDCAVVFLCRLR